MLKKKPKRRPVSKAARRLRILTLPNKKFVDLIFDLRFVDKPWTRGSGDS
jgi:hypothetical protein